MKNPKLAKYFYFVIFIVILILYAFYSTFTTGVQYSDFQRNVDKYNHALSNAIFNDIQFAGYGHSSYQVSCKIRATHNLQQHTE